MSSKLNVSEIMKGHLATLKASDDSISKPDIATFLGVPLLMSTLLWMADYDVTSDLRNLLVNFGAIFTALLLSVLVLVYDQERKCGVPGANQPLALLRKDLLHQLYYNISFSIILAVALCIACLVHAVIGQYPVQFSSHFIHLNKTIGSLALTPIIVFITTMLFLNVVMIVKRMHALLTTG